jgi:hypothetical protein
LFCRRGWRASAYYYVVKGRLKLAEGFLGGT